MQSFERDGLTFDVTDTGPADGPVVILLHGFPEDRSSWLGVAPALVADGYRVLAPDQRGYSPRARPKGRSRYQLSELVADVIALADAAGADRFDVVGHDWGAAVAWAVAGSQPLRVRSLTALSVPHSGAFLSAMARSSQLFHSWYMLAFQIPYVPERLLSSAQGSRLAAGLERSGLPKEIAARYGARGSAPDALTGPINWYRALPWSARVRSGPISVPTLFVYGDADAFITKAAAERCADWVSGPYRFEVLRGADHWLPENRPDEVSLLLLEHLKAAH